MYHHLYTCNYCHAIRFNLDRHISPCTTFTGMFDKSLWSFYNDISDAGGHLGYTVKPDKINFLKIL